MDIALGLDLEPELAITQAGRFSCIASARASSN